MHVLSASSEVKSGTRFGNYKDADKLDKNDPLCLHAKEVDFLKVVICRFIKSQLTGQSLINALDEVKEVNKPPTMSLRQADVRAAIIIKVLSEGLGDGGDGSASTCTFAFVLQTVLKKKAATEWELEALLDHFHALFASKPINECEVISGRAYTGPLYVKMNGSLRFASKKFGNQEHLKGNSYTNLIYACNSLLRKSSEISIIPPGRTVFRGMSGVKLPECFKVCREGGGRGGVDFGFLSATTNELVAVSYLGGKAIPVLFQFDVGDIDRGASLSFLSQYPNEDEVLIPPLSYLEVIGDPFFKNTDKGEVTVYPARINCNLKSQTIEEIKGHRQKEIHAMLPYLKGALHRDMAVLVEALAADFKEKSEEMQLKKLDELQAQILRDFDALSTDLATPGKMSWLNEDTNYKQSICEVIDFKNVRLSKLVKEMTNLHVAAREGRTKTIAARLALGLGADIAAKDKDGKTSLMLACANKNAASAAELMEATKNAGALDLQDGYYKRSALHYASSNGLESTVVKLLSLGADATLKDLYKRDPIDLAANEDVKAAFAKHFAQVNITDQNKNELLLIFSRLGMASRLPAVLLAGADLKHIDEEGMTSLMLACRQKNEAAAAELMEATKNAGALDLRGGDYYKRSALHYASIAGLESTVAKLLSLGADAARKDWAGMTSLMLALENNHQAAAEVLWTPTVQSGAGPALTTDTDGNIATIEQGKPLGLALFNGRDEAATVLWGPSIKAGVDIIDGPVLTTLYDARYSSFGESWRYPLTALMAASHGALTSKVEALLAAGAHAGCADKRGRTSLIIALASNDV
jgi:ankyrin repeat protein